MSVGVHFYPAIGSLVLRGTASLCLVYEQVKGQSLVPFLEHLLENLAGSSLLKAIVLTRKPRGIQYARFLFSIIMILILI